MLSLSNRSPVRGQEVDETDFGKSADAIKIVDHHVRRDRIIIVEQTQTVPSDQPTDQKIAENRTNFALQQRKQEARCRQEHDDFAELRNMKLQYHRSDTRQNRPNCR